MVHLIHGSPCLTASAALFAATLALTPRAAAQVCGDGTCASETVTSCPQDCSILNDFEDGTVQGWIAGPSNTSPPAHALDAGPEGAGDDALLTVDGGTAGRLVFFNTTEWTGDFIAVGRERLYAHVRNTGTTVMTLRLAMDSPQGRIASNDGVVVPADGAWHSISFPLDAASFSVLGVTTVPGVLGSVIQLRILHATTPSFTGDNVDGELIFDNISDTPLAPLCGDGEVNGTEACDDGLRVDEDGCSALCVIEECGDGVTQGGLGETCDDGNTNAGDGCDASCIIEPADMGPGMLDQGPVLLDQGPGVADLGPGVADLGPGMIDAGPVTPDLGLTTSDGSSCAARPGTSDEAPAAAWLVMLGALALRRRSAARRR